nr:PadR family transcriptional regulator [Arthrobacter roseus]
MRAALTVCVLKTLDGGPTYGYAIATDLERAGFGDVKGGTLYPLLTRLETAGLVTTEWRKGDGGPGRKYFTLTEAGRTELTAQSARWQDFTTHVQQHLSRKGIQR